MKVLLGFILMVSTSAFAAKTNPYCRDFQNIKNLGLELSKKEVDRVLPRADWLDERYRREDRKDAGMTVAKTVFMVAIGRLSWFTYAMIPTRAEAATMTGMYSRNPENYAKFLNLSTENACFYLSMPDSDADRLREITRELWLVLDQAR